MCFSAQASFSSGTILTIAGIATLRKSDRPEQKLFAAIPLIFAFQQFAEGVLWLTLKSGKAAELQNVVTHIFLVAALVIWPVVVPLSMRLMEHGKGRKIILSVLTLAGGILGAFYAHCLISYNVTPQIQSFHIQYNDNFPYVHYAFQTYLAATLIPLFVSSVKRMWLFGGLMTVSCVVTGIFYAQYLTSVWCFFAAGLSVVIYWVLSESTSFASVLSGLSAERVLARIRNRGDGK